MATAQRVILAPPDQVAKMTPEQRAGYLAQIPAEQRGPEYTEYAKRIGQLVNRNYLAQAIRRPLPCPPINSSGGSYSAAYAAGADTAFSLPVKPGAIAHELIIQYDLTVTIALGAGAAALNPAAPWNIMEWLQLNFGEVQHRVHPYQIKRITDALRGYRKSGSDVVTSGQQNATIQAQIKNTMPVVNGANTWRVVQRIPFNPFGPQSGAGLIPVPQREGDVQVVLTPPPSFNGPDPFRHVINLTGGAALTSVTGTVRVYMEYTDGLNFASPHRMMYDPALEPTVQYSVDNTVRLDAAGTTLYGKFSRNKQHQYVHATVIDGQQSNRFASHGNITLIELAKDSTGDDTFYRYGGASNIPTWMYHERIREVFGQDLDEGEILHVAAPTTNVLDPDDMEGAAALEMSPGGWTTVYHGYQLASIGATVAGIVPRVEVALVSIDLGGLDTAPVL